MPGQTSLRTVLALLLLVLALPSVSAQTTREQAERALEQAAADIAELETAGLSTVVASGMLAAARIAFEGRNISDIVKPELLEFRSEAQRRYFDWLLSELSRLAGPQAVDYDKAIELTRKIAEHKSQAFEALDRLSALRLKLVDYAALNLSLNSTRQYLSSAEAALAEERYADAIELISAADAAAEAERAERTLLAALTEAGRGWLERNWRGLVYVLAALAVVVAVGQHPLRRELLKRKIARLRIRQAALRRLVEKSQADYFKHARIAKSVYDLRMSVYKSKLDEVAEELPLLEARLKAMRRFP